MSLNDPLSIWGAHPAHPTNEPNLLAGAFSGPGPSRRGAESAITLFYRHWLGRENHNLPTWKILEVPWVPLAHELVSGFPRHLGWLPVKQTPRKVINGSMVGSGPKEKFNVAQGLETLKYTAGALMRKCGCGKWAKNWISQFFALFSMWFHGFTILPNVWGVASTFLRGYLSGQAEDTSVNQGAGLKAYIV